MSCRVKHSVRCGHGTRSIACVAILPRGTFRALFPNRTECFSRQNGDKPGGVPSSSAGAPANPEIADGKNGVMDPRPTAAAPHSMTGTQENMGNYPE